MSWIGLKNIAGYIWNGSSRKADKVVVPKFSRYNYPPEVEITPRKNKRWGRREDKLLKKLVKDGLDDSQIARRLGRGETGVKLRRLYKLKNKKEKSGGNHWSKEELYTLKVNLGRGKSYEDIAKIIGRNPNSVKCKAYSMKLVKGTIRRRYTPEDVKVIMFGRENNWTPKMIAQQLGRGENAIRTYLWKLDEKERKDRVKKQYGMSSV